MQNVFLAVKIWKSSSSKDGISRSRSKWLSSSEPEILTRLSFNLILVIKLFYNKPWFKISKNIYLYFSQSYDLTFGNFINIFCFVINCDISIIEGERKLYKSGWLLKFDARIGVDRSVRSVVYRLTCCLNFFIKTEIWSFWSVFWNVSKI